MKSKAQILAQWVIGILLAYPVLIIFIYLFHEYITDSVMSVLVNFCIYILIPMLIVNWILAVWSLKLERKNRIGYFALVLTILYSVLFLLVLYGANHIKMC